MANALNYSTCGNCAENWIGVDNGLTKLNCWDFMKCGREINGARVEELGPCPVCTEFDYHGINRGVNAGRACWVIAGTKCGGKTQGNYAQKLGSCLGCEFFNYVRAQEGDEFMGTKKIKDSLSNEK